MGGPVNLSNQPFYVGINDLFGDSQTGAPFNPIVFTLYDPWANRLGGGVVGARAAVARGQALFNGKPIRIMGVLRDQRRVRVRDADRGERHMHNVP
jgi:hypothetical protein